MDLGKTLIDAAASKTGMTRYRMSLELRESQSFLSRVYSGKAPIPPGLAARLAVLAGIDARRAALEAMVSQEKNAEVRAQLESALGVTAKYPENEVGRGTLLQTIV